MGFMPDVKKIVGDPNMPKKADRLTLMFSATFPEVIRNVAQVFLNNYIFLSVGVVGGACTDVDQVWLYLLQLLILVRLSVLLYSLPSALCPLPSSLLC